MFIRTVAVDNHSAGQSIQNGAVDWQETLININDIVTVTHMSDDGGPESLCGEKCGIELRLKRSDGVRVNLMCKDSVDEIQGKIERALATSRSWGQARR